MEIRIRDYKPKDQSKKRLEKRELELKILKLLKDEGQHYRVKMRQGLMKLQNNVGKEKGQENKQPNVTEVAGLYPNLEGWLHFNGNVKEPTAEEISQIILCDKAKDEDKTTTPREDKNPTPKSSKDSPSGMSESQKSVKAVIAEKRRCNEHNLEKQVHGSATQEYRYKTSASVKVLSPKHCSTARKVRHSMPAVLDCYEGRKSAAGEQSYSY
ncbi:hypothetical protein ABVT39_026373 [Epinephelus coioides]